MFEISDMARVIEYITCFVSKISLTEFWSILRAAELEIFHRPKMIERAQEIGFELIFQNIYGMCHFFFDFDAFSNLVPNSLSDST